MIPGGSQTAHRDTLAVASALVAILTTGCGYMGEPMPPALRRPVNVTDLAAAEHGRNIVIHFTIPKITTEGLAIKGPEDIELRVGAEGPNGFHIDEWAQSSDRVPDVSQSTPIAEAKVDAAKYVGKTVVVGVRVHGPTGKDAGWSNLVPVQVVPPLPKPIGLEAKDAPDAVDLEWHAAAPEFRVFRKTSDTPDWSQLGTSMKPSYMDSTIDYGKVYQYYVQSIDKAGDKYAESDESDPLVIKPVDTFPPAVPAGLSALAGTQNIELVWDRNTEKDFASYRVYRNGQKIAENLTAPAYSDKAVQPGMTYRYQVSAVDTAGNESAKSAPVESVIP